MARTAPRAPARLTAGRRRPSSSWRSHRFEQDVLFLAERELDHAVAADVLRADHGLLVADGNVVHPHRTALNLAPRLAVRLHEPRAHERGEHAEPLVEICFSDL